MMGEHGQAELLEVVLALQSAGRFPRRLHAGSSSPMSMPMIVMTTRSSTKVKPGGAGESRAVERRQLSATA